MTLEAHAERIQTALGSARPRNQRLPIDLFTPFIEELWKGGTFPSASVLQQWFPGCSLQALGMACFEWRSHQGLQLGRRKQTEIRRALRIWCRYLMPQWRPPDTPVLILTTTGVGRICPARLCIF